MEMAELTTLQWLGEHVTELFLGRAIFHRKLFCLDVVHHKEISDIDVARTATAQLPTILFKQDGAFIILEDLILVHAIPLCIEEVSSPKNKRHNIIDPN
jgi:hypothetical protein